MTDNPNDKPSFWGDWWAQPPSDKFKCASELVPTQVVLMPGLGVPMQIENIESWYFPEEQVGDAIIPAEEMKQLDLQIQSKAHGYLKISYRFVVHGEFDKPIWEVIKG